MIFRSRPPEPPPAPANPDFMPWLPEYRIGIARFDAEHQHLAAVINAVHRALVLQRDRTRMAELLEQLLQETRVHFTAEESALEAAHFPELASHHEEHTALLMGLREHIRQHASGTLSSLSLLTYLRDWLVRHIQSSDRAYAAHLKRRGER